MASREKVGEQIILKTMLKARPKFTQKSNKNKNGTTVDIREWFGPHKTRQNKMTRSGESALYKKDNTNQKESIGQEHHKI